MKTIFILSIASAIVLGACSAEYQSARNEDGGDSTIAIGDTTGQHADSIITRVAEVDSVTLQQSKAGSGPVSVLITGKLPDECTKLDSAKVRQSADTFIVTLETRRLKDEMCAQTVVPYQTVVPLNTSGISGAYHVNVNGTFRSFNQEMKHQPAKK